MNQMSYPYMPDINTTNIFYHYNKIVELEQKVKYLENEVNSLKKQITKKGQNQPLTSKYEIGIDGDNGIYML